MSAYVGRVFAKSCERMGEIPDGVVQTCVTSPPYYGLRDYGVEGQIGLEETVDAYVERLVGVFREVRRVLRDDGTLWLNLGDSYAGSWGAQSRGNVAGEESSTLEGSSMLSARQIAAHPKGTRTGTIRDAGLKPKDLMGIPWRVAFALQTDGWWLRSAIVWAKPNPMPSSVTDRPTSSYEMVFLLSKAARYFYDADAIREPLAESSVARLAQSNLEHQAGSSRANGGAKTNGPMKAVARAKTAVDPNRRGLRQAPEPGEPNAFHPLGANKRDVWMIATTPFTEAHFATFPPELPLTCIRASTRPGDVVLDPFMGSGTTAEAAESVGRQWTGYELNPAYHALIAERTRQRSLLA